MTTFPTTGVVDLTVDLGIRSDIWVTAVDRSEVTVDIRPRSTSRPLDVKAAEQATVEFENDRLLVQLKQWRRYSWFTDGGAVDVTIEVPIGSALDLASGMGNVVADGEFGAATLRSGMGTLRIDECRSLRAKTGQGDVTVGGASGQVEIATGTGKVRVRDLGGPATIKNSNGETQIGQTTGQLSIRAANGDILIDRAAGDVTAKASNGAIRIADATRGSITAATSAGAIEVGVRPGTAAWLDLSTKYGRVHNELAAGAAPERSDDTVEVRAHSAYGDITIHRSTREQP